MSRWPEERRRFQSPDSREGTDPACYRRSADSAWAAGVVEGEGCLRLHGANYCPAVIVSNTDPRMLVRLQAMFGAGRIRTACRGRHRHPGSRGRRRCFQWSVFGQNAVRVLREIRPYLVMKLDQADVILLCPRPGSGHPATDAQREERRDAYAELARLKRVQHVAPCPLPYVER